MENIQFNVLKRMLLYSPDISSNDFNCYDLKTILIAKIWKLRKISPNHDNSNATSEWLWPHCASWFICNLWFASLPSYLELVYTLEFIIKRWKSHALSFYRSQNVLGWSRFFVPEQRIIYILWQSQTFCARKKGDLHFSKIGFCAGTKVFEEALNAFKFLAGSKNLDRQKTFWDL